MCGRITSFSGKDVILEEFGIKDETGLRPSYNVAPTQMLKAIIAPAKIEALKWGIIPSWSKTEKTQYKMINARKESISTSPVYKRLIKKQKCAIIVDGFYEWEQKTKKPYYIKMKNSKPFTLAGLYDEWKSDDGREIKTCTIITTEPNEIMKKIHNRMPAILGKKQWKEWIETEEIERSLKMIAPYKASELTAYKVWDKVNSVRNNTKENIESI